MQHDAGDDAIVIRGKVICLVPSKPNGGQHLVDHPGGAEEHMLVTQRESKVRSFHGA
jgi:hypothetical protein